MVTRAEAGALQKSLTHRLSILKNLWHAEPVGLASLGDWIADIADEMSFDKMRGKLREMEVFTRVRKTTTLTEHDAGVQTITDPAGGGFVLQDGETTTNTDTGLDIDTMEGRETLTPQTGDTGEQRFPLCSNDMSRLVATSMGQSNPRPKLVGHVGEAGTVTEQRGTSKAQTRDYHFPYLEATQTAGVKMPGTCCQQPEAKCTSCGFETYECLRVFRAAYGKRCDVCGSQGHITHVCIKEKNLYTKTDRA